MLGLLIILNKCSEMMQNYLTKTIFTHLKKKKMICQKLVNDSIPNNMFRLYSKLQNPNYKTQTSRKESIM